MCLSVCVSQKIITSHFRAEGRRREVSRQLGLAGVGRLWPSDDDDNGGGGGDDDDGESISNVFFFKILRFPEL